MATTMMTDRKFSMRERAAARVRVAFLERQRATKAYKDHMKNAKVENMSEDVVLVALREKLDLAKANHVEAVIAEDAVRAQPPLVG